MKICKYKILDIVLSDCPRKNRRGGGGLKEKKDLFGN